MAFLLHHWLDRAAASVPEKSALIDSDGTVTTYRQLRSHAQAAANQLRAASVSRGDRVAIVQKRSSRVIASIFGALYAEAIYVPVHSGSPAARFREILDVSCPAAIICDKATQRLIEETLRGVEDPPAVLYAGGNEAGVNLPEGWRAIDFAADVSTPVAPLRSIDVDTACLIFTSGTTGQPKGVAVTHRGIIDYMDWAEACFELSADDRILATAPFHFDMSTFDVHAAVRSCATLCVASDTDILFPGKLLAFIQRERPTIWKGVSSLLAYLAKTGELAPANLASLSRIVFAGEKLPTRYLIEWMKALPSARYFNGYGPTEATGVSICHEIRAVPESAEESMPIGVPCSNTEAFVVDESGRLLGDGEIGELCIRGSCLAQGYWNDAELTRCKFVSLAAENPLYRRVYRTGDKGYRDDAGNFFLIGRVDDQVKVQGYRIELGEVIHALESCQRVLSACVLCEEVEGVSALVAFVEVTGDCVAERDVIAEARRRLPAYMMPARFVIMDSLPRTDRGKVDKLALAQSLQSASEDVAAIS